MLSSKLTVSVHILTLLALTPTVSLELSIAPPIRNHNSYDRRCCQADLRGATTES